LVIYFLFFCGLHFFCVPYSISVLLLLATKGTQKKKKKKELLVGEIFVRKFLLFSLRFLYIFFGFLGTSLRASQKQLARLLLIVPFEYFTAGIAATLWLMASLVVTPLVRSRDICPCVCIHACICALSFCSFLGIIDDLWVEWGPNFHFPKIRNSHIIYHHEQLPVAKTFPYNYYFSTAVHCLLSLIKGFLSVPHTHTDIHMYKQLKQTDINQIPGKKKGTEINSGKQ